MASTNHVAHQLAKMGLEVAVDGDFILCEDPNMNFERSHDGVRGIAQWLAETREEYKAAVANLFEEGQDEERAIELAETAAAVAEVAWTEEEEPMFTPAPPEKEHVVNSAQIALAKELNGPKEVAQATRVDDQDRGGIPSPETYIRDMKLEAPAITVLMRGHTFHAPDGWKIKEARPYRTLYHGSINIGRKKNHELKGSRFSLVRL